MNTPIPPEEVAEAAAGREQFVGWIADRFIECHAPTLPRQRALRLAEECLSFTELAAKPFGHPDFDWSESGARAVADEDISHWER